MDVTKLPCLHDESRLAAAANGLAAAGRDLDAATAAAARAEGLPWHGPASTAFHRSAASVALQLAGLAAGVAALATLLYGIQADAAVCTGVRAGAVGPVVPQPSASPLFAQPRAAPLLPQPVPAPLIGSPGRPGSAADQVCR